MSSDDKKGKSLIEEQVYRYLQQHPEFLTSHSELLVSLELKHRSGEASSLIEHQVARLRSNNEELSRQMKQLVQIAGENEKLMSRLHRLTLKLTPLTDLATFFSSLATELKSEFSAEQLFVGLFCELHDADPGPSVRQLNADDADLKPFTAFLDNGDTACGRLNMEKLTFLFGKSADEIKSTSLVPLGENAEYGFMAIGSTDPSRFFPGMGTLFLDLLGDVVSHRLAENKLEPRRRSA